MEKSNILIKLLFTIGIWLLSYIIKKDKNTYLFSSENKYDFWGNWKYLFEHMKKNTEYNVFFLTQNKKILNKNNKVIDQYSKEWIWLLLRSNFIISWWGIKSFFPLYFNFWRFNYINLWHWDTYKKLWYENTIYKKSKSWLSFFIFKFMQRFNKLVITWNKFNQETFQKTFFCHNVKITWLPRYDIFFKWNQYLDTWKVRNNFSPENFDKIYLYAPTWRDNSIIKPFSDLFLEKLNGYLEKNNSIFLVKMHPVTKERINCDLYRNIIDITDCNYDTQELLKYSDILIVDYSSISIDFYLTNKPIIFYPYDKKSYYSIDREMYLNYDNISIRKSTTENENTLFNIILNIEDLSNTKEYKETYKKYKDFWHINQNWWYSEMVLKEIEKLI